MKALIFILINLVLVRGVSYAQRNIRDSHITNQQERMVFKQWDRKKFTPTKGFLGLNPMYWITWGLHPDYPKTDLRPLSAAGNQTQRLALVLAMQQTDEAFKLHSDTISSTALSETASYAGILSSADPLWLLYYSKAFSPLLEETDPANGASPQVMEHLQSTGTLDWYLDQRNILSERLHSSRTADMERGSRITTWHRLLLEVNKLEVTWQKHKQSSALFLALKSRADKIKDRRSQPFPFTPGITNRQIADRILNTIPVKPNITSIP
ncbi:MAG: hypothetical protein QHC79_25850 [Pseudosphingobacterium sp.]|nr:hypothetical protein [Pseudosphingobacterium sp.]